MVSTILGKDSFLDKHPIIDVLRTAIFDDKRSWKSIIEDTNGAVTEGTVRKWLYGETKRPQYFKVAAVLAACNVEIRFYRRDSGEQVDINPRVEAHYLEIKERNRLRYQGKAAKPANVVTPPTWSKRNIRKGKS